MAYMKITAIKIFELIELMLRNKAGSDIKMFFIDMFREKLYYLLQYLINYDLDFKGMARIARLIERQFTSNDEA
jgi:hypothetical protein